MKQIKLYLLFLFLFVSSIFSQVVIIPPGGTNISIDNSSAGATPAWTTLGVPDLQIIEGAYGDIGLGVHTLTLPAGWEFNTGVNVNVAPDLISTLALASTSITPGATTLTFTVTAVSSGPGSLGTITISNMQVRPTGTSAPTSGDITHTAGSIVGVVNGTTSFGTLSTTIGTTAKFIITGLGTQTAGTSQDLTITAADQFGNTTTGYVGDHALTFSGATPSTNPVTNPTVKDKVGTVNNFGVATTITFVAGVATVGGGNNGVMTLYKTETANIVATEGVITTTGTDRLTVVVSAATVNKFVLSLSSPQINGAAFTGANTLRAEDAYGNATAFDASLNNVTIAANAPLSGVISGLSGGNKLSGAGDFVAGVANLTTLGMVYTGVTGTGTFTASSAAGGYTSTSAAVVINAGVPDANQSTLTPTSATIIADNVTTQTLTVTAKDASGNTLSTGGAVVTITKFSGVGTVSAVTDNGNGTYTATVKSNLAGTGIFVATLNGNPVRSGTLTQTQSTITFTGVTAFTMTSPVNGSVGESIVPLITGTITGLVQGSTQLILSTTSDFSSGNITYSMSTTPAITQPGGINTPIFLQLDYYSQLINGVKYYVRVVDGGYTSSTFAFTAITLAMPYLTNPMNGAELSGAATIFAWYSGIYSIQYVLQVVDQAVNPTFNPLGTFVINNAPTTNLNFTVNNNIFIAGHTYLWRVTAQTIEATPKIIDYSTIWQFLMPGLPQPVAWYPTGNVNVYINPTLLSWGLYAYNPKVSTYHVKYRRADQSYTVGLGTYNNLQGYFNTSSINQIITLPYALDAGYRYYWEVASSDGTNESAFSLEESFTVYSSATFIACYPSYPIAASTIYTNPPTLYWYTNTYAPGITYTIEVHQGSTGGALVHGSAYTSSTPSVTIATLAADHYYWKVRATLGGVDGPWSDWGDFVVTSTTTTVSAPVPVVASPTGGVIIGVTNPTLTWYAYSSDPIQYQVLYSSDPNLTSGELSSPLVYTSTTAPWLNTPSYVISGLTKGATYYWQVRSRLVSDPTHPSAWSTIGWFTVSAGAAAVVPIAGYPLAGTVIKSNTNNSVALSWVLPDQSSSELIYTVQYSKSKDFNSAQTQTISNLNSLSVTLNNLDRGTTYYWRASSKTKDGSSVSGYSGMGSFKTEGTTAVENKVEIPTAFELSQNYPNPFNPTTMINFALPQNSYVTIKIFDMLGQEIKTLVNEDMNAGLHSTFWNGENNLGQKVASGTYLYRISAGDFISTKKMVLIK